MNPRFVPLIFFACSLLAGCRENSETAAPVLPAGNNRAALPSTEPSAASRAQPRLPTVKLWLGTNELTAEIARSRNEISTGMMWRTNMAEMEGMLFVFPQSQQVSFYMRNTLVPLSCAYIDPEGTILELHHMKPLDETSIPSTSFRVQYVLEVNQGWFQRHNVTPGMRVTSEHGSLNETFFSRR